jgi:two-component system chemotaxis sensor kinase CheA
MDEELRGLMVAELERHLRELDLEDAAGLRRTAHSLKGSFGMAGVREASALFARLERRLASGDPSASSELVASIATLLDHLAEGRASPLATWPEPPHDLAPLPIDPAALEDYRAAARDRLSRIDATLAARGGAPDPPAVLDVFREVHTLKGAALAVGDEVMAWFCHGLEERLRGVATIEASVSAFTDVETYRGVLAEIVDAPDHALATLRLMAGAPVHSSRAPIATPLPLPPKRPAIEVPSETDARGLSDESTVRVSIGLLEALFERVGQVSQLSGPLSSGSAQVARSATAVRDVARSVREALRMIGPPRPWGAPAAAITTLERSAKALDPLASGLDATASHVSSTGGRLGREGFAISTAITSLRTTTAALLFDRVTASAHGEARRMDRDVEVLFSGSETPIDRRLVEALVEPLRQLARNAIVHGLEPADARVAAGKQRMGTLRLSASLRAGSLVITVDDDGAGVDAARVRQAAVRAGVVSPALAASMSDGALLTLLFYPGFSMRAESDLLAGRGVGLDLALAAVHRIGGTIHLESRPGLGLTATLVVPAEGALVRVVWLACGGNAYALPVQHTGQVGLRRDASEAVSLGGLLRGASPLPPGSEPLTIEVVAPFDEGARVLVAVDSVGRIDEVALRTLPSIARAMGPWSGAILWADELRLALDPTRLVQLARAASRAGAASC